eukprot:TRINITY_DN1285_c0_g1_i5.p1 TRINITY_DN1285_c0_g1~~TRINITY_DN1285_c0_g1_i5.p1  ORF type:complete len:2305 (-),score=683.79 TRINITY_DN1285_c0_g1_i5:318-7232(-)
MSAADRTDLVIDVFGRSSFDGDIELSSDSNLKSVDSVSNMTLSANAFVFASTNVSSSLTSTSMFIDDMSSGLRTTLNSTHVSTTYVDAAHLVDVLNIRGAVGEDMNVLPGQNLDVSLTSGSTFTVEHSDNVPILSVLTTAGSEKVWVGREDSHTSLIIGNNTEYMSSYAAGGETLLNSGSSIFGGNVRMLSDFQILGVDHVMTITQNVTNAAAYVQLDAEKLHIRHGGVTESGFSVLNRTMFVLRDDADLETRIRGSLIETPSLMTDTIWNDGSLSITTSGVSGSNISVTSGNAGYVQLNGDVFEASSTGVFMSGSDGVVIGSSTIPASRDSEMFMVVGSSLLSGDVKVLDGDVEVSGSGKEVYVWDGTTSSISSHLGSSGLIVSTEDSESTLSSSELSIRASNGTSESTLSSVLLNVTGIVTHSLSEVSSISGWSGHDLSVNVSSGQKMEVLLSSSGESFEVGPASDRILVARHGESSGRHVVIVGPTSSSGSLVVGNMSSASLSSSYDMDSDSLGVEGRAVFGDDVTVIGSVFVDGEGEGESITVGSTTSGQNRTAILGSGIVLSDGTSNLRSNLRPSDLELVSGGTTSRHLSWGSYVDRVYTNLISRRSGTLLTVSGSGENILLDIDSGKSVTIGDSGTPIVKVTYGGTRHTVDVGTGSSKANLIVNDGDGVSGYSSSVHDLAVSGSVLFGDDAKIIGDILLSSTSEISSGSSGNFYTISASGFSIDLDPLRSAEVGPTLIKISDDTDSSTMTALQVSSKALKTVSVTAMSGNDLTLKAASTQDVIVDLSTSSFLVEDTSLIFTLSQSRAIFGTDSGVRIGAAVTGESGEELVVNGDVLVSGKLTARGGIDMGSTSELTVGDVTILSDRVRITGGGTSVLTSTYLNVSGTTSSAMTTEAVTTPKVVTKRIEGTSGEDLVIDFSSANELKISSFVSLTHPDSGVGKISIVAPVGQSDEVLFVEGLVSVDGNVTLASGGHLSVGSGTELDESGLSVMDGSLKTSILSSAISVEDSTSSATLTPSLLSVSEVSVTNITSVSRLSSVLDADLLISAQDLSVLLSANGTFSLKDEYSEALSVTLSSTSPNVMQVGSSDRTVLEVGVMASSPISNYHDRSVFDVAVEKSVLVGTDLYVLGSLQLPAMTSAFVIGNESTVSGSFSSNSIVFSDREQSIESTLNASHLILEGDGRTMTLTSSVLSTESVIASSVSSSEALSIASGTNYNANISAPNSTVWLNDRFAITSEYIYAIPDGAFIIGLHSVPASYNSEDFVVVGSSLLSGDVKVLDGDVEVSGSGKEVYVWDGTTSSISSHLGSSGLIVSTEDSESTLSSSELSIRASNGTSESTLSSVLLNVTGIVTHSLSEVSSISGWSGHDLSVNVSSGQKMEVLLSSSGESFEVGPASDRILVARHGESSGRHVVIVGPTSSSGSLVVGNMSSASLSSSYDMDSDSLGVEGRAVFGDDVTVIGSVFVDGEGEGESITVGSTTSGQNRTAILGSGIVLSDGTSNLRSNLRPSDLELVSGGTTSRHLSWGSYVDRVYTNLISRRSGTLLTVSGSGENILLDIDSGKSVTIGDSGTEIMKVTYGATRHTVAIGKVAADAVLSVNGGTSVSGYSVNVYDIAVNKGIIVGGSTRMNLGFTVPDGVTSTFFSADETRTLELDCSVIGMADTDDNSEMALTRTEIRFIDTGGLTDIDAFRVQTAAVYANNFGTYTASDMTITGSSGKDVLISLDGASEFYVTHAAGTPQQVLTATSSLVSIQASSGLQVGSAVTGSSSEILVVGGNALLSGSVEARQGFIVGDGSSISVGNVTIGGSGVSISSGQEQTSLLASSLSLTDGVTTTSLSPSEVSTTSLSASVLTASSGANLTLSYDTDKELSVGGGMVRIGHASAGSSAVFIGSGIASGFDASLHVLSVAGNSMFGGNVTVPYENSFVVGSTATSYSVLDRDQVYLESSTGGHASYGTASMLIASGSDAVGATSTGVSVTDGSSTVSISSDSVVSPLYSSASNVVLTPADDAGVSVTLPGSTPGSFSVASTLLVVNGNTLQTTIGGTMTETPDSSDRLLLKGGLLVEGKLRVTSNVTFDGAHVAVGSMLEVTDGGTSSTRVSKSSISVNGASSSLLLQDSAVTCSGTSTLTVGGDQNVEVDVGSGFDFAVLGDTTSFGLRGRGGVSERVQVGSDVGAGLYSDAGNPTFVAHGGVLVDGNERVTGSVVVQADGVTNSTTIAHDAITLTDGSNTATLTSRALTVPSINVFTGALHVEDNFVQIGQVGSTEVTLSINTKETGGFMHIMLNGVEYKIAVTAA